MHYKPNKLVTRNRTVHPQYYIVSCCRAWFASLSPEVKIHGKRRINSVANPLHPLYKNKFAASAKPPAKGSNDIPQSQARTFMPPKTSVWRGNNRGLWACHVKGHRRFSEPWSMHGGDSFLAMIAVAQKAWRLFCRDEQLDTSVCPIADLFPSP